MDSNQRGKWTILPNAFRETRWFYHKYSTLTYVSHYVSQRRRANKIKVVLFNLYQSGTGRTEDRIRSSIPIAPRKLIHWITKSNTQYLQQPEENKHEPTSSRTASLASGFTTVYSGCLTSLQRVVLGAMASSFSTWPETLNFTPVLMEIYNYSHWRNWDKGSNGKWGETLHRIELNWALENTFLPTNIFVSLKVGKMYTWNTVSSFSPFSKGKDKKIYIPFFEGRVSTVWDILKDPEMSWRTAKIHVKARKSSAGALQLDLLHLTSLFSYEEFFGNDWSYSIKNKIY